MNAWAHFSVGAYYYQPSVGILGAQDHSLRLNALERAWREVGDKAHILAHEVLGVVELGDARDDGASLQSVVDGELEELVGLLHLLTGEHLAHADVELLEVVERHRGRHSLGLEVLEDVLLLDALEAVGLNLYGLIIDFLEEQFGFLHSVASLEDVDRAQLVPVGMVEVDHLAQFLGAEWEERLKGDGEVGSDLQGNVHDCLHACHVGLGELPWLGVGKILVAYASQLHRLGESGTEVERVESLAQVVFHALKLLDGVAVVAGELVSLGNNAIEVFIGEHDGAVHEVAQDGHQLVVVAVLEILPGEVVVLSLGGIGGEHVAVAVST